MRIYRCYSPSRQEHAEDWNGYAYGEDPDTFVEMVEEMNHPSASAPHDWELQEAEVVWKKAAQ